MAHDVFICHAHDDYTAALAACAKLEESDIQCWIAPRDVGPGAYAKQLVQAIDGATAVLLVFSDHANRSEHVLRELEIASKRQRVVIPFKIENVLPNEDLEYFTLRLHWFNALDPPFENRLEELVLFVRRHLEPQLGVTPQANDFNKVSTHSSATAVIRNRLLAQLQAIRPQLLRVVAPAGYGKSTLVRQYAGAFTGVGICDCLGIIGSFDVAKRLMYALTTGAPDADIVALEALSFGDDVAAWTALCERLWTGPHAPPLLVIENAEALQADLSARGVIMALLAAPNPGHHIALCSRVPLSLRSGRFASPSDEIALGVEDLRFGRSEIADSLGPSVEALVARVEELTQGWPMAVFLLGRLLQKDNSALERASTAADLDGLYDYLADEVIASISEAQRSLLTALAFVPQPTLRDISYFLGEDAVPTLADLQRSVPFVAREHDGTYSVHPLVRAMLRGRHEDENSSVLRRIAGAAADAGDRVRAAQLYLECRDLNAAGAVLNFGSSFFTTPTPAVAEAMMALDGETLVKYPAMWSSATLTRVFEIGPHQWTREAEYIWHRFRGDEDPLLRAGVMGSLVNVYANEGRFSDAIGVCDQFEASLQTGQDGAASMALSFWRCVLASYIGRAADPVQAAAIVAPMVENPGTRALFGYDVIARIHRINGDRSAERAELQRCLDMALGTRLPLVIFLVAMDAAFGAWFAGEDELFEHYLAILEEHAHASVLKGCRIFIDAARHRLGGLTAGTEKVKSRAYAFLIAAAHATTLAQARSFAIQALTAADHSAQPFAQVAARLALGLIDPEQRDTMFTNANQIASTTASGSFAADVRAATSGFADDTMLAAFVRRMQRIRSKHGKAITVCFLEGTLRAGDGATVSLTGREYELMAFLSLARRPLEPEEILNALWMDKAETAGGLLKASISRLRRGLGTETIQLVGHTYVAAIALGSDLIEVEEGIRSARRDVNEGRIDKDHVALVCGWFAALRNGFPARVARWRWFAETAERIRRELSEAMVLCAGAALDASEYETAHRIGRELAAADELDDFAQEICIRADIGLHQLAAAELQLRSFAKNLSAAKLDPPGAHLYDLIKSHVP